MGKLKNIDDFFLASIEHVSGGEVLSREEFDENGNSKGLVFLPHKFCAEESTNFVACFCGKHENNEIHNGEISND